MKIVKRRGTWLLDWYDFGVRRTKVFKTKRDAEDFGTAQKTKQRQVLRPTVDAHMTLRDFSPVFLARCLAFDIKPRTIERYASALNVHILPALGDKRVREVDRPSVDAFLMRKKLGEESRQGQKGKETAGRRKLAPGTVLNLLMTLSSVMRAAVAVQLIVANPLGGLTRDLRLTKRKRGDKKNVKAFDQGQLVLFLTTARAKAPDVFPALAVMGFAGLRVGEAMALKWENLDLAGRTIHVCEQISGTTKGDKARDVAMADALHDVLVDLQKLRRAEAFKQGREMSPYALFPAFEESTDRKAEQTVVKLIRRRMQAVLKTAGLPEHHTPHSLRHSFASILISKATPIVYVQQALGHASIALTVDTYGSWLPVEAPGAVNVLAAGFNPAQPVAKGAFTGSIEKAL